MSKDPNRVKAGKRARRRGAGFERKMAKLFADWWHAPFARTPLSGGSHLKDGWDLAGDLTTTAPDFPFHMELKAQECFPGIQPLLHPDLEGAKTILKWWDQAMSDCPEHRVPVLIMTKNHYPVFVLMQAPEDEHKIVPAAQLFIKGELCYLIHIETLVGISKDTWLELYGETDGQQEEDE